MNVTLWINRIRNNKRGEGQIDYEEAREMRKRDSSILLLDVRSRQEYQEGNLPGSINLPVSQITKQIGKGILVDKKKTVIVYCQSGSRSKKAKKILEKNGFLSVYELENAMDYIGRES